MDPLRDRCYAAMQDECTSADDATRAMLYRLMADWWEDHGHDANARGYRARADALDELAPAPSS